MEKNTILFEDFFFLGDEQLPNQFGGCSFGFGYIP